jgi:hypothetical protein
MENILIILITLFVVYIILNHIYVVPARIRTRRNNCVRAHPSPHVNYRANRRRVARGSSSTNRSGNATVVTGVSTSVAVTTAAPASTSTSTEPASTSTAAPAAPASTAATPASTEPAAPAAPASTAATPASTTAATPASTEPVAPAAPAAPASTEPASAAPTAPASTEPAAPTAPVATTAALVQQFSVTPYSKTSLNQNLFREAFTNSTITPIVHSEKVIKNIPKPSVTSINSRIEITHEIENIDKNKVISIDLGKISNIPSNNITTIDLGHNI